ncbi:MAG: FAD:protein FMN transferase [Lachnospiraceae bacterium]|nr:FAD:protein FMN transferase [Lachnospiraceae bacterium]
MKRKIISIVFLLVVIVLLISVRCFKRPSEPISRTGFYFDTVISVQLNDTRDEALLDGCFELASKYENMLSKTVEGSDVYRMNTAGGATTEVSEETAYLLKEVIKYSKQYEGIFDVTIGAVTELWDFRNGTEIIPDEATIKEALKTVDYKNIVIEGNTVTLLNPDTKIDLGAMAKGYIADKMKEYLNASGCHEGIINLGGNVLTVGPKSSGETYNVGIRKPFKDDGEISTSVKVIDKSVTTSGCTERYFIKDDRIYHHIINPKTGYPFESDLYSVSIVSDSSLEGDVLGTIYYALGKEQAEKLIKENPDVNGIIITDTEEIITID